MAGREKIWAADTSLPAIEMAKIVKAIDVFAKRPDIDPERIAMVGHSYGGLLAMVAPRPLLVESGNQDQLLPIAGARRAAPEAASFYARQGAADRFRFMEFVGRHDLDGDEAVRFIDHHLPRTAKSV